MYRYPASGYSGGEGEVGVDDGAAGILALVVRHDRGLVEVEEAIVGKGAALGR